MSFIFPIILIILSLAIIIFLIVRKLPQLVLLDVDSIPEVRENKKKNELLKRRLEEKAKQSKNKWSQIFKPLVRKLKEIQLSFRKYVGRVEKNVVEEIAKERQAIPEEQKAILAKEVSTILQDAVFNFEHEDWEGAEKKYIAAIKIDPKNEEAYYGLGLVYKNQKHLDEAEETWKFLLQLNSDNSKAFTRLAELAEERGKIEEAVEYYQQSLLLEDGKAATFVKIADLLKSLGQLEAALEAIRQAVDLEPQNPKYLDNYLEISIMLGNKKTAEEVYQQLRMVNPENQKLLLFKERIEKCS